MKNKIIMYLVDNEIICFLIKENKIVKKILTPKILKQGKIIHRPKFQKEITSFLKKEKILKKFRRNIMYMLTPPNFEEIDAEIIQSIIEELPVEELKFIKEKNLYQLDKNTLWINYNQNYGYLSFYSKKKEKHIVWNEQNEFSLIEYIEKILKNHSNLKKIVFIGTNKNIPEIVKKIEQNSKKIVLYYEESNQFLLKKIIRHNF